jgi:hypothetical protein
MDFDCNENLSCGVLQAYRISDDPRVDAVDIAVELYFTRYNNGDPTHGIVIFSDVVRSKNRGYPVYYGASLARYLGRLGVGQVTASAIRTNPNSGNRVRVWTFAPNHRKFRSWALKQKDVLRSIQEDDPYRTRLRGFE